MKTDQHGVRVIETRPVLIRHHDDGLWYRGQLLHSYRGEGGRWRGVVRYYVGTFQYQQARWQEELARATGVEPSGVPVSPPSPRDSEQQ